MSRVLVIQSFRKTDVPPWIARCLESVRSWALGAGHDYWLTGDEAFDLCGADYLARVGANMRSITNLCRLELLRRAHADGYDWAVWLDADIFVFDPASFEIGGVRRLAFARETWVEWKGASQWRGFSAVNNSTIVCRRGEPDLDFLIAATRHVAMHRQIGSNYQVGGQLIRGLREPLAFETRDNIGMFSNFMMLALAREINELIAVQARLHGTPVAAANLCASANYEPIIGEADARAAMDLLESTRGGAINRWLDQPAPLAMETAIFFQAPGLDQRLGLQ
jgi:hypothetical protein